MSHIVEFGQRSPLDPALVQKCKEGRWFDSMRTISFRTENGIAFVTLSRFQRIKALIGSFCYSLVNKNYYADLLQRKKAILLSPDELTKPVIKIDTLYKSIAPQPAQANKPPAYQPLDPYQFVKVAEKKPPAQQAAPVHHPATVQAAPAPTKVREISHQFLEGITPQNFHDILAPNDAWLKDICPGFCSMALLDLRNDPIPNTPGIKYYDFKVIGCVQMPPERLGWESFTIWIENNQFVVTRYGSKDVNCDNLAQVLDTFMRPDPALGAYAKLGFNQPSIIFQLKNGDAVQYKNPFFHK
jgi:hypothetical protein